MEVLALWQKPATATSVCQKWVRAVTFEALPEHPSFHLRGLDHRPRLRATL